MDKKRTIKRVAFLALWLLILSGMTTLLIAANSKKKAHLCTEVLIGIRGTGEKYYIEKEDILQLIEKRSGGKLLNRPVTSIHLSMLEKALEHNSWIRDAELYFDSRDALHVFVEEREPIARVFTTSGNSFYIDSSGHQMALVDKLSARVPVITGFIDGRIRNKKDSTLLEEVKEVARVIYSHDFWNAQIGQIDITADRRFELVPVIGDHIIQLGNGKDVARKLDRLFLFYRQVMRKTGFNKYAALQLQFEGQVVAVRREPTSPVDSLQLQKNIEELVNKASLQEVDQAMLPDANSQGYAKKDSTQNQSTMPSQSVSMKTNPNPVQSLTSKPVIQKTQPVVSPRQKPAQQKAKPPAPQPKAVMKRA